MKLFESIFGVKKRVVRRRVYIRPPKLNFVSGETHYYKGRPYLLNVIQRQGVPRVELDTEGRMHLYVREGSSREQREKVLDEWYRKHLKAQIPLLVSKWESLIGVKINEHNVKKMSTRWGTCNIKARRIWLSLELAKKPEHCLEYVVVHEMVHLLEKRHDARFKSHMDRFMPEWRSFRKELSSR